MVVFMSKHKVKWVNDHIEICDRLDERVQLMETISTASLTILMALLWNGSCWVRPVSRCLGIDRRLTLLIMWAALPAVAHWKADKDSLSTIFPRTTSGKPSAGRSKTSVGWFYGFKLHLIINDISELLAVELTPGNTDDRKPVRHLTEGLFVW